MRYCLGIILRIILLRCLRPPVELFGLVLFSFFGLPPFFWAQLPFLLYYPPNDDHERWLVEYEIMAIPY